MSNNTKKKMPVKQGKKKLTAKKNVKGSRPKLGNGNGNGNGNGTNGNGNGNGNTYRPTGQVNPNDGQARGRYHAENLARIAEAREKGTLTLEQEKTLVNLMAMDPRATDTAKVTLFKQGLTEDLPQVVQTTQKAFAPPIMSVVSGAIVRGWLGTLQSGPAENQASYPYWAFVWHVTALYQSAKSGFASNGGVLTTVPKWFAYMVQSVVSTTVKARGGSIVYNYDIDGVNGVLNEAYTIPIGPVIYNHEWWLGRADNNSLSYINGFSAQMGGLPIMDNPEVYTAENGLDAAISLWDFIRDHPDYGGALGMHQRVAFNADNEMTNDVSAFAAVLPIVGGGTEGTGGYRSIATSEIPVRKPLFSVFNASSADDKKRALNFVRALGGDGMRLGEYVTTRPSRQFGVKNVPNIKFLDFNMFLDVMLSWINQIQTGYVNQPEFLEQEIQDQIQQYTYSAIENPQSIGCPMTLQQLAIILRNELIVAWGCQHWVQGTFPRVPSAPATKQFQPFVSSVGTSGSSVAAGMLLPKFMAENIKCLAPRSMHGNVLPSGKNNMIDWVPCLGMVEGDVIVDDVYGVYLTEPNSERTQVPSLADSFGEIPVSMVDGLALVAPNPVPQHIDISNTASLGALIEQWNIWVKGRVSNNHTGVEAISTDGGVNAWCSIISTDHISFYSAPPPIEVNKPAVPPKGLTSLEMKSWMAQQAFSKKMASEHQKPALKINPNPLYQDRIITKTTFVSAPFGEAWDGVQQYFIRPMNFDNSDNAGSGDYERIAAYTMEYYALNYQSLHGDGNVQVEGEISMTIAQKNSTLATLGVKGPYADEDLVTDKMEFLDTHGMGGLLASIGAMLVGTFVPELAPVANAVAAVIPF